MKSKALLFLFIFLLNTATGFACALRMSVHEHDESTEHHHEGNEATEHHHEHDEKEMAPVKHQLLLFNQTSLAQSDPCCQGAVNSFNTLAKITPQSTQIILLAPFTYIGAYYQFFLNPVTVSQSIRLVLVDGRRRPPTYPIRIALQSFQI
ncbi:hypothetical protein [Mucilaginibacter sp.]|jgi:hypothetical protein|uniref:hypothetical protein n=1 Tax=Mucilaginibacter sp. TaxID=1882438 RepID=UPI00356A90AF